MWELFKTWLSTQGGMVVFVVLAFGGFLGVLWKFVIPRFDAQQTKFEGALKEQITEGKERDKTRDTLYKESISTITVAHERSMGAINETIREYMRELRSRG